MRRRKYGVNLLACVGEEPCWEESSFLFWFSGNRVLKIYVEDLDTNIVGHKAFVQQSSTEIHSTSGFPFSYHQQYVDEALQYPSSPNVIIS